MRNVIGSPVEKSDFFDRKKVLDKLLDALVDRSNILLVAPRRVGKTSLVLKLRELWKTRPSKKGVYINVEGQNDEFGFTDKLIGALAEEGIHPELLTRVSGVFAKARQLVGLKSIKASGLEMGLSEAAEGEFATIGKAIESVFHNIEAANDEVVIIIDELPEFLLNLQKEEGGEKRVGGFLHKLREWRQSYRDKIRWIFLGSIGLDTFVEQQGLQKTINDLQVESLDAFTLQEADAFLAELAKSYGLNLTEADRAEVVKRIGWPLAYHLQLFFHELRETEPMSISAAFDALLKPEHYSYYDTWHQRLKDQFPEPETKMCKDILGLLCKHPEGRSGEQIFDEMMRKPNADPDKTGEMLRQLLVVLARDGYLLEKDGNYAFRSFLLREYWKRRHTL